MYQHFLPDFMSHSKEAATPLYSTATPLEVLEQRIAPATFLVTSLADSGAGSLRDAVDQANSRNGKDTIVFDKSAFTEGALVTLTTGEIAITDDLTIKGLGADFVTVSGNESSRIFRIDDGTAKMLKVSLSGLTLQKGYAGNDEGGGAIFSAETLSISDSVLTGNLSSGSGGAIHSNSSGDFTAKNLIVSANTAEDRGGGIYLLGGGGAKLSGVTVSGNFAVAGIGGIGISVAGAVTVEKSSILQNVSTGGDIGGMKLSSGDSSSKIVLRNTTISGNFAAGAVGGVLVDGGKASLDKVSVTDNSSQGAGGLASAGEGSLQIKNSQFLRNSASSVSGGGLYFNGSKPVTITGSKISGNTAAVSGGGIMLADGASLSISNSEINGNAAVTGAGLAATDGSLAGVAKSSISNNLSSGAGAGFLVSGSDSFVDIKASTFQGNVAIGNGGAGFADSAGAFKITASTFDANRSSNYGGALAAFQSGNLSVGKSTFYANIAVKGGGAIHTSGSIYDVKIDASAFIANRTTEPLSSGTAELNHFGAVTLTNSLFTRNHVAGNGGGVVLGGVGFKTLTANTMTQNEAGLSGGGVFVTASINEVKIVKGTISGNVAGFSGGGVANLVPGIPVQLSGVVISGNFAPLGPNTSGDVTYV